MLLDNGQWNWNHVLVQSQSLNLVCDHTAREKMFHSVLSACYACFSLWKKMSRENNDWIEVPQELIDEMNIPPPQYQWIRNLSLSLLNHSYKCRKCQMDSPSNDLPMDSINTPYLPGIHPPSKQRRILDLPPPLPLAETDETASSSSEVFDNDIDWGQFDEYHTAPIWTSDPPPIFDVWTFNSSGLQILPNFCSTWKDRGYRLLPHFAKVSQKQEPTDLVSRLLPTTNDAPQIISPSLIDNDIELPDDLQDNSTVAKPVLLGAKAMINEAGRIPKTKNSYNVFIQGKTRTGDFLALDLEQDHNVLTRDQISISIDIDSVIFVATNPLSCKGAINLHLLPQFSDKPPFSANPSVYIRLLGPPEDQSELDHPHFRRKTQYPLSSIPHIPFGYFGEASQQFSLYVFFPRMIHKNTNNNRAITIMPHQLQELWISEVIFKALATALSQYPGISEYLPHSIQQLRRKGGDRARHPTIPLAPDSLASLFVAIRQTVSQNDDLLSCFGSFFFVLDARGIKSLSKQYGPGENTFQALQRMVPTLDWNHMLDRANGELYLDLGVSFHPKTIEPMVGLWRLEGL